MKTTLTALLALTAFLFTSTALADEETLKKIDIAINQWKTLDYRYKIVTTKKGDAEKKDVLKLRMRMKYTGAYNKQLIEIAAPADMKGTKVLTKSPTEMYIYLPAFKKVRRIASHVTEQGFLGTALSQKDMTLTRYGDKYRPTKMTDRGDKVTLELAKTSDEAPYPNIELTVEKERMVPTLIKYYSDGGKLVKTERRSQYRCEKGYCAPGAMKVTDHSTGVTSILYLKKMHVNPKLKKSLFSKRSLQ
jgi:hypothetical protein